MRCHKAFAVVDDFIRSPHLSTRKCDPRSERIEGFEVQASVHHLHLGASRVHPSLTRGNKTCSYRSHWHMGTMPFRKWEQPDESVIAARIRILVPMTQRCYTHPNNDPRSMSEWLGCRETTLHRGNMPLARSARVVLAGC